MQPRQDIEEERFNSEDSEEKIEYEVLQKISECLDGGKARC